MTTNLSDKFTVRNDGNQWILSETYTTKSTEPGGGKTGVRKRYFPRLEQALLRFMELEAGDTGNALDLLGKLERLSIQMKDLAKLIGGRGTAGL